MYMIKKYLIHTKFNNLISEYLRFPLQLRLLNWFVQRCVYRTQNLSFSLHFGSRITHANKAILSSSAKNSLAQKGGCYLECSNGVEIGDGTIIAPGVKIISANHNIKDLSKHEKARPVRIGRDCWIGANAVILPGVELGDKVIVAAGAVVTKSFSSKNVVAGNPARVIK